MKPLAQNSLIQNRYLIVQLIGKGGMGEVYLAVDQRLGSAVALKRTYFAGDEMLGNAFEREARTLARMRHPVLPKVSDHFGEGDEQYLVMEHISGDDLAKRIEAAQKPFPISWVLFWADQLLDALAYLHSHEPPIIHRDIKPQNLKLTDENNIILLDFGLSKTTTGMTNISQSGSTGSVVGYTPHYAPMEQIRGIGTSARSDLYSLSATLYQLLTNTVPPDALSRADTLLNGEPDPVIPLDRLNPEVSKPVSDVIIKGMEVSQEKRFADAREMQKVLRRAFSEMQDAMSASTVAFGVEQQTPAKLVQESVERSNGTPSPAEDAPVLSAISEETSSAHPAPPEVDLEATIAYEPVAPSVPRQSDVKTEVFLAGSENFQIPETAERPAAPREVPQPDPDPGVNEAHGPVDTGANGGIPNATMPIIAFDPVVPELPASEAPAHVPATEVRPSAQAAKTGGRSRLVIGALAALLLFVIAAAGIGGVVYWNYFAGTAVVEPTPSPEPPPPAPSPTPEPTIEAVIESNVNTESNRADAYEGSTNTNLNASEGDLTVAPTPMPGEQPQKEPSGRSAASVPPPAARPSVVRPVQSAPQTQTPPKPKTRNSRTDILQ